MFKDPLSRLWLEKRAFIKRVAVPAALVAAGSEGTKGWYDPYEPESIPNTLERGVKGALHTGSVLGSGYLASNLFKHPLARLAGGLAAGFGTHKAIEKVPEYLERKKQEEELLKQYYQQWDAQQPGVSYRRGEYVY